MKTFRLVITQTGTNEPDSYIEIKAHDECAADIMMESIFGSDCWWVSLVEVAGE